MRDHDFTAHGYCRRGVGVGILKIGTRCFRRRVRELAGAACCAHRIHHRLGHLGKSRKDLESSRLSTGSWTTKTQLCLSCVQTEQLDQDVGPRCCFLVYQCCPIGGQGGIQRGFSPQAAVGGGILYACGAITDDPTSTGSIRSYLAIEKTNISTSAIWYTPVPR